MRVGIISDTHMPKRAKKLPKKLIEGLQAVDLIIHAGDWTSLDVYHELLQIAPVLGVFGNVDPYEVQEVFEEKVILEVSGFKIGVIHGHAGKKKNTPARALEAFQDNKMDVIIFGHSHIPYKEVIENTLLFNPGSPTDKRFQPQYSFGLMEIHEAIQIEHQFYKDKG